MEILNKEQLYKGTCTHCKVKISITKEECQEVQMAYWSYNGYCDEPFYYTALGIKCPTPCCNYNIAVEPYDPNKKWYQFWK